MGTTASKPATTTPDTAGAQNTTNTSPAATQARPGGQTTPPAEAGATCPLGFDKKKDTKHQRAEGPVGAPSTKTDKGCPVNKDNAEATTTSSAATAASDGGGGAATCPVKGSGRQVAKYLHPHKFNVYGQRVDGGGGGGGGGSPAAAATSTVDPSNNMPSNPNQLPAPGQHETLSTERVRSTIPKGGEETTWTYPSSQMFWNALSRKGKAEDTDERDMDVVVSIHNNMNEITWKKILQWERLRTGIWEHGAEPRLLRFLGRPDDTTPKALAKMMLGHPLPFDRHDWVVDRGGDERRYVIDYYHDEGVADGDEVPELHDEEAVKSIKVDVRPALDGFRDFADRVVQMPLARLTGKSDFVPLPMRPSPTMERREPRAKLRPGRTAPPPRGSNGKEAAVAPAPADGNGQAAAGTTTTREGRAMARMQKKCAPRLKALRAAEEEEGGGDAARAKAAALKLEYCTARYLCKKEAREYKEAVAFLDVATKAGNGYWAAIAVDRKLSDMREALARFTQRQAEARGGGRRGGGGDGGGGGGGGGGEDGH